MFKQIDYSKLPVFNYGLYQAVFLPKHQDADKNGNVYLHRLVAEQEILHRPIKKEEVVHHIDENKFNNNPNNLLVFKTKNDHAAFHAGESLIKESDVYISTRKIYYCKSCGIQVTCGNDLCRKCALKLTINKRTRKIKYPLECKGHPNKEELKIDLLTMNYSEIGRKYGVSANAIKKRAIKFGLYKKIYKDPPLDFNINNSFLSNHILSEVAKYYDVSKDTVVTWAKNTKTPIMKRVVHCIDTDEYFDSGCSAVRKYFPKDKEPRHKAEKIGKAIKNKNPLWNKHWEYSYVPTYY